MNRAQKAAWLGLIGGFISIIMVGIIGYLLFIGFPKTDSNIIFKFFVIPLLLILFLVLIFFLIFSYRKKQSPNEPDVDERDKQISRNAAQVCLLSLCLLIYLSDMIILIVTGLDGWIPSCALPVIHFGVGFVAFTIYYVAMIILYGKDNKNTEGKLT